MLELDTSADAFDSNATDVGLSLDLIEEEVEAGLPAHAERLAEAFLNEEYHAGRNLRYVPRRPSEEWTDYLARPKRTSKLTRKVINTLTADLYAPGPTRKLADAQVDAWLQDVYAKNNVDALMQQADRKATLNATCAIQATATGRAEKPVLLSLWGAHELVLWSYPDDPTEAWAACTVARERKTLQGRLNERLRLEVWSRDEHRVYFTRWNACASANQWSYAGCFGVQATYVPDLSGMPAGSGVNPYGCLPFTLVSDEVRVSSLWEGGIGTAIRECNAEIDRSKSDRAQLVKAYSVPDGFVANVAAGWRSEKRVGAWQRLTPGKNAEGEPAQEPKAWYVQPALDLDGLAAEDCRYANETIEELDLPLSAVRADASTDLSGIAIVAKQLPLLTRARRRQVPFTATEQALATMVLTVAGNFYGVPELTAAAPDPGLTLIWPEPSFPLPTPERDQADEWEMSNHVKSLVMVTAERLGVTRDQAIGHLKQVAKDNAEVAKLLPPPEPPADPNNPDPAPPSETDASDDTEDDTEP